jgi:hypothetical protein
LLINMSMVKKRFLGKNTTLKCFLREITAGEAPTVVIY